MNGRSLGMTKKPIAYLLLILAVTLFGSLTMASQANSDDVRRPAVAGQFYPEAPSMLRAAVEKFLEDAVPVRVRNPVAIVVPHAGYIFSGQIAADAFKQASRQKYDLVVILGTNHTSSEFRKIAVYPGSGFRTPLGVARIDREVVAALIAADPDCIPEESVHEREHSVEVQVPFVQVLFPEAKIVPIIVGTTDLNLCSRFGLALAKLIKNRRALIVASSDLSHYPSYDDAVAADRETLEALAKLDPALFQAKVRSLTNRSIPNLHTGACGEAPILAAMTAAKSLGAARGVVVSYANSGDTSVGERSRVVGYGAVALTAEKGSADVGVLDKPKGGTKAGPLLTEDKKALLRFARSTISRVFETGTTPLAKGFGAGAQQPRGCFVTLRKNGQLRGCIGQMVADAPLCKLVGAMALKSAFQDSRFRPVSQDEMGSIEIEISVLTPLRPVASAEEIVVGRDGVVIRKDGHSAVYLPQVATEQGWGREEMLDNLCLKAGLLRDGWREGAQFSTFQAVVFSENAFK